MTSRRDLFRYAAAAAALTLHPRLLLALEQRFFIKRAIPSSGEMLPIIGLGSSATFSRMAADANVDTLRALEDVVRKLESGEVPLDESINLYERGEALRQHCQKRLDAAQARIEKIVAGPDGAPAATEPFDAD